MKIAILGGSFNPPHICHTFACCYVLAATDVDQLWVVPCYRHAFGKPLEAFEHRFAMCQQAIAPLHTARVLVSDIERARQGTSWTIDTARHLRAAYPDHEFLWVIGSDVLMDIDKWRDFEELNHLVTFLVVPRGGFAVEPATRAHAPHSVSPALSSAAAWPPLNIRRDLIATDDFQLPDLSSSLIRQRIQAGQSITHLVSKTVADYIDAHQLYRSPES